MRFPTLDEIQIIISVAVAIGVLWQNVLTRQQSEKIQQLDKQLDQSLRLLHLLRDATIRFHEASIHLALSIHLENRGGDGLADKLLNYSAIQMAAIAEIAGIIQSLNDSELTEIMVELDATPTIDDAKSVNDSSNIAEKLHKRISQLIQKITTE